MLNRLEANIPTMTLELRIQPLVKNVIQRMLLSEQETTALIESAVNDTVARFDWREQIKREVESTLRCEIDNLVRQIVGTVLYDEELREAFRKRIAAALTSGKGAA